MKLRFRVGRKEGSKQARKNGDIEALADAMRALKNKEKHWERRISCCFLISLRIEEIDDSRGLDSGKINTDENLISVVETSMADDQ